MKYQSETISTILTRLNVNYFLPAIQREYVWHPDQIVQLFDSIMRNYPVGSFLFWELNHENHYKWDIYRFVQNFKQDATHNEPASTAGVHLLTRVLTIFVRANQGGTKRSKSDLLLSMVTAKWDGINARDEIYDFVDRLNNQLTHKNNFDKDFIMKTCLVLSDLQVQYKVENFNNQNLMLIHSNWKGIKAAIETTANLVNSFGINRDTLTSANALIPIIYFLYKHPGTTLLGGNQFEVKNA